MQEADGELGGMIQGFICVSQDLVARKESHSSYFKVKGI